LPIKCVLSKFKYFLKFANIFACSSSPEVKSWRRRCSIIMKILLHFIFLLNLRLFRYFKLHRYIYIFRYYDVYIERQELFDLRPEPNMESASHRLYINYLLIVVVLSRISKAFNIKNLFDTFVIAKKKNNRINRNYSFE